MNALMMFAQNNPAPDIVGGVFSMILVLWILGLVATVFWFWMMIDALVNEPRTEDKLLWFLVIFLLHFVGALVYFVVRRTGRTRAAS